LLGCRETRRQSSRDAPAATTAGFDADMAASEPVTLAQWQRRPLDMRLKEMFGRLWQYWL
jgi:cardiolipin synthase